MCSKMNILRSLQQILLIYICICEVYSADLDRNNGSRLWVHRHMCTGNEKITFIFYYLAAGYELVINKQLEPSTEIKLQLDSGSTVAIQSPKDVGVPIGKDAVNNIFTFLIIKNVIDLKFFIEGRYAPNHLPYVTSIVIDGVENCENPERSYFDRYIAGVVTHYQAAPDKHCGRRKVNGQYTELIISGSKTKVGDWPWHAAVMRVTKFTLRYTCGGTLISKYLVLTAAHCGTINGIPVNPEILIVFLGKHTLFAKDALCIVQEKEVVQVILHNDFRYKPLKADIALLKLKTEAVYNNYVQPACIWFDGIYDHIGSYDVEGSVVGWGLDNTDNLSNDLKAVTMPLVPHTTCIWQDAIFYSEMLKDGKAFCAGHLNGTSVCNGDSGGGYLVFVQDDFKTDDRNPYPPDYKEGAWYVKGIVSVGLARPDAAICNPNAYAVFTDVAKYRDWILNHMK